MIFRCDVEAGVTGSLDESCACFRDASDGATECRCTSIDTSDPSGPKFRSKETATHGDTEGEGPIAKAQREMRERNAKLAERTNRPEDVETTPNEESGAQTHDANESPIAKAQREMKERNAKLWKHAHR